MKTRPETAKMGLSGVKPDQSSSKLPVQFRNNSTCLLLLSWINSWIDTTSMHSGEKRVVDQTVLLCMEIRIEILVNVRFYYGAISNEQ